MTTTLKIDPRVLEILESKVQSRQYEQVLEGIYQILWESFWDDSYKLRFNHIPELDALVQRVGRELLRQSQSRPRSSRDGVNVFIASEVYRWGGHTRVLEDLTHHSQRECVLILTDLFDGYATGKLELGPVADQLNASVCVLPKMSLTAKTKSLIGLLNALHINAIGILAHHQDVIAYGACNEELRQRQVYIHHADHHPTLGATIAHYQHIDLFAGNLRMCQDAGYVTPRYMPPFTVENFQRREAGSKFNTATSGTFNKFSTSGDLSYADIVIGILSATNGNHIHIGSIPDDYLGEIESRLRDAGIEPSRFKYLGIVASLQQALIDNDVDVYITSAPVGGGKAYTEAVGLGLGVLLYLPTSGAERPIFGYAGQSYGALHSRWSDIGELQTHLLELKVDSECEKSRAVYSELFSGGKFMEVLNEYF